MRAVVIAQPGGPEVLEIEHRPNPRPTSGEILVRVAAFGLNRADLLQRRGMYPAPPGAPQDIPGLEFAGTVEATGPQVEGVVVGDRVMGIVGGGAYAEQLVVRFSHVVAVPASLSLEQAAAIPEVFVTAHDALERLAVQGGEWVLVHAVGSGVGTAAVQLLRARGARVIGTSRTADKLERAKELGMEVGVDTVNDDLGQAVRSVAPRGVDAVVDLVGGSLFAATLDVLAHRGRLILVGLTAGRNVQVDLGIILGKRLRIEGTVLRARDASEKTAVMRSFGRAVLPLLESGTVRPVIDRVFPLNEIRAAHAHLESNATFGKVVVQVA